MDKSLTEVAKDMDHILTMQSSIRVKERKRREGLLIHFSLLDIIFNFESYIILIFFSEFDFAQSFGALGSFLTGYCCWSVCLPRKILFQAV